MKRPIIIDVEASGFGRGSYPIEVGIALASGEGRCTFILPDESWQHWDPQAQALHGISRQVLAEHGRGIVEVARLLNKWLGNELVYSDGWGNDSSWLALLFEFAGIGQQFRLESLRSILTDTQADFWHIAKDKVIEDYDFRRHRASGDALILQQSYCHAVSMAGDTKTANIAASQDNPSYNEL
jgi:hypothetical protein